MVGRGLAPAAGFALNYGTGTDRSLRTKNNGSVEGDDTIPQNHTKTYGKTQFRSLSKEKIYAKTLYSFTK